MGLVDSTFATVWLVGRGDARLAGFTTVHVEPRHTRLQTQSKRSRNLGGGEGAGGSFFGELETRTMKILKNATGGRGAQLGR